MAVNIPNAPFVMHLLSKLRRREKKSSGRQWRKCKKSHEAEGEGRKRPEGARNLFDFLLADCAAQGGEGQIGEGRRYSIFARLIISIVSPGTYSQLLDFLRHIEVGGQILQRNQSFKL